MMMSLPLRQGKEIVFQKVKKQQGFILENQERKLTDFSSADIEDYLKDMFATEDQFVILTAPEPQHEVRYVQTCVNDGEIEVELGIEDEEGTHLYDKKCTEEECCRIFTGFYVNTFVPKMEEYKPVEF